MKKTWISMMMMKIMMTMRMMLFVLPSDGLKTMKIMMEFYF
jgi:hypothetical protein